MKTLLVVTGLYHVVKGRNWYEEDLFSFCIGMYRWGVDLNLLPSKRADRDV